jgi:kynurenine 3-monooxygenase
MESKKIVIIGAGLSGTLLAIRMAQKGHQVSLFEKRSDIRKMEYVAGRSINLALSDRGLRALRMIGMDKEVESDCIPMLGRKIHPVNGDVFTSFYSGRQNEYINSISRSGLNISLLNAAEKYDNLELHFNTGCESIDLETPKAVFKGTKTFEAEADYIFGADGANSAVRKTFQENSHKILFSYSQEFLSHAYKELTIPPNDDGSFRIDKNGLHIWPRGGYMMIALPNLDGSFTVTLFLAHKGENSFEKLDNEENLMKFFEANFPDAIQHMPTMKEDFFQNPTSLLYTVKCSPWHANNKVLVLGDAAHAIVPFYGQGMNASFEDVVVFDELLEKNNNDWDKTFAEYDSVRKKDSDAIADLAIDNFLEMRDKVADDAFQRKRKLEMELEKTFPDYFSKYSMVTFNENIPYSVAMNKGRLQDDLLMEICKENEDVSKLDLTEVFEFLKEKTKHIH